LGQLDNQILKLKIMYNASEILSGKVVPVVTKSIQANHGRHDHFVGIEPIAEFGGGFRLATDETFDEESNVTEYDGFNVMNDTQQSNDVVMSKIYDKI
jgi:hypothetical protein